MYFNLTFAALQQFINWNAEIDFIIIAREKSLGSGHYLWWGWHRREKGWENNFLVSKRLG
jgi:hypothetical protein